MKAIVVLLLTIAAASYAQAPYTQKPPHNAAAPQTPPAAAPATQAPPPSPTQPPTELSPKESTASLKLALAESQKANLESQRTIIANAANQQLQELTAKINEQDKEISSDAEIVKKENGWGKDVYYVDSFQGQDGRQFPAHWQKTPTAPPASAPQPPAKK